LVEIHLTRRPFVTWKQETLSEKAVGGIALTVSTMAGSTFAGFSKKLRSSLSPLSLLFVSELLNAFFVLFSFGFLPVIRSISAIEKSKLKWLALLGFLSGVAAPMFWFAGLSYTSAVNASFFAKSELIFLMLLSTIVLKDKLTKAHFAAIISVIAGIIVIGFKGLTQGIALHPADFLIIGSALCYACGNITFRSKLHGIEPHIVLFSRSTLAIATFFIVSPFISHPFVTEISALSASLIPVLIGFAFVSRFLNSVTYYVALDRLPVPTISLISTLDIIGSILFAFFYLGEPIEWYHYLGGLFIILGNVLLEILGTHPDEVKLEEHLKQRLP
jgi:drug/metabolite transporter (DMT)-like permease